MNTGKPKGSRRVALVPIGLVGVTPAPAFPTMVEIAAASGPTGAVLTVAELARRSHCTARAVKGHLHRLQHDTEPFGILTVSNAEQELKWGRRFELFGVPAKRDFVGIDYSVRARVHRAAERPGAATGAGVALKVYAALNWHHRPGGQVYPSIDRLADIVDLQRRSVERGLAVLEEAGVVRRRKRMGTSNLYVFPPLR